VLISIDNSSDVIDDFQDTNKEFGEIKSTSTPAHRVNKLVQRRKIRSRFFEKEDSGHSQDSEPITLNFLNKNEH
jgi:hypothetical protein